MFSMAARLITTVLVLVASEVSFGITAARAQESGFVTANVEFVEADSKRLIPLANVAPFNLLLGIVSGHIVGEATSGSIRRPVPDSAGTFVLNLDQLQVQVAATATSYVSADGVANLVVTPADTKFARVATTTHSENEPEVFGHTGWLSPASREPLVLVYFDQPCHLEATETGDAQNPHIDIDIPKAGLYWFRPDVGTENRVSLSISPSLSEVIWNVEVSNGGR